MPTTSRPGKASATLRRASASLSWAYVGTSTALFMTRKLAYVAGSRSPFSTQGLMVVYFAVHRQHLLAVGGIKRLTARLGVDDAQTLVGKNGRPSAVDAAPVGTTMTDFLTHSQGLLTEFGTLLTDVEEGDYSTHIILKVR